MKLAIAECALYKWTEEEVLLHLGQVDGCADIDGLHLEPDHAAQDAVGLFLVELPGFFQTFGPFVFSDRHHMQVPFFFILAVSILTQTQIAFQSAIAL